MVARHTIPQLDCKHLCVVRSHGFGLVEVPFSLACSVSLRSVTGTTFTIRVSIQSARSDLSRMRELDPTIHSWWVWLARLRSLIVVLKFSFPPHQADSRKVGGEFLRGILVRRPTLSAVSIVLSRC